MDQFGDETLGKWQVGGKLGEGGFSQVRLGRHEKSGELAALKILEKKSGSGSNTTERKQVESEIDAMKKIKHKHVIQMKDFDLNQTFRKKNVILVVLELAKGGELFDYLSFTGKFEEPLARSYFQQLMEGVKAAHDQEICHRDLKPENLLMDENFHLKIADFGFAHSLKNSQLYTECGTTGYMAPEMFNTKRQGYDGKKTDVWACGVILFILMAGFPPYQKPARNDWWFDKLMKKKYGRFWMAHCRTATFSDSAKDLINKIFQVDSGDRISVDEIMEHDWYNGETLSGTEITKLVSKRKMVVDAQNRQLKVQQQQEQEQGGFGMGTVRDIGEGGEMTEEEAALDDLPEDAPTSIIYRMDTNDEQDNEDNQEEDDGGVVTGGFGDLGGMGGMDSLGDMDDGDEKEKGPASVYNPTTLCMTTFNCNEDPSSTLKALESVLSNQDVVVEPEGYTFNCTSKTLNGKITYMATVYKKSEDSDISVVEIRRGKGQTNVFRDQYAKIRNAMEAYADKQSVEKSGDIGDDDEKVEQAPGKDKGEKEKEQAPSEEKGE